MFEINLSKNKQNLITIKEIHNKFEKSKKNNDLCTNEFWDDHCFWRGTSGRRGNRDKVR